MENFVFSKLVIFMQIQITNYLLNKNTRACFHNSHHQHTFSIFFVKLTFFCIWPLIKGSSVISELLWNIILNMMACYYDLGLVVWCVGVAWCGSVSPGVTWCGLMWVNVAWYAKRYSRIIIQTKFVTAL